MLERRVVDNTLVSLSWDGAKMRSTARPVSAARSVPPLRRPAASAPYVVMPIMRLEEEKPICEADKACYSVAVLFRMLTESQIAQQYSSLSVWRCFKDILVSLFVDWTDADDAWLGSGVEPHGLVSHLQTKYTFKDACGVLQRGHGHGLSERLAKVIHGQNKAIVRRMQDCVGERFASFVRVSSIVGMAFQSWKGYIKRMKYVRNMRLKLMRAAELEQLRRVLSAWRRYRFTEAIERINDSRSTIRESLESCKAQQLQLVDQVRTLKSLLDQERHLTALLKKKLNEQAALPTVLDLSRPIDDEDGEMIHHGVVEFRHITPTEWDEMADTHAERVVDEAQCLDIIKRSTVPAAIHRMSVALSHPSVTTLTRLGKDLASFSKVVKRGHSPSGYYTILGMRKVTLSQSDGAVKKGAGYINGREILLSWANTKIMDGFPHTDYNLEDYRVTPHHVGLDGRALLLLLHVIVPYGEAATLTIDAIDSMGTVRRFERLASVVNMLRITDGTELLAELRTGLCEDSYNVLLAQLYVYDHLNSSMRRRYAEALERVGVEVPGILRASICVEKIEPLSAFQSFTQKRRRASNVSDSGSGVVEGVRRASAAIGMIPNNLLHVLSDLKAEPAPSPKQTAFRLVFQPGIGIQILGKHSVACKEVQCNFDEPPLLLNEAVRLQEALLLRSQLRRTSRAQQRRTSATRKTTTGSLRSAPSLRSLPSVRSSRDRSNGSGASLVFDEGFMKWQMETEEVSRPSAPQTTEDSTQTCFVQVTEESGTAFLETWVSQMTAFLRANIKTYREGTYVPPPQLCDLPPSPTPVPWEDSTSLLCVMKVLYQSKVCYEDLAGDFEHRTERLVRIGSEVGCVGDITAREVVVDRGKLQVVYAGLWLAWCRTVSEASPLPQKERSSLFLADMPHFSDLDHAVSPSSPQGQAEVQGHHALLESIHGYYSLLDGPSYTLLSLLGYMQLFADVGIATGELATMISRKDLEDVFKQHAVEGHMDVCRFAECLVCISQQWDNSTRHMVFDSFMEEVMAPKARVSAAGSFFSLFETYPVQQVFAAHHHALCHLYQSLLSPTFDHTTYATFLQRYNVLTGTFTKQRAEEVFAVILRRMTANTSSSLTLIQFCCTVAGIALSRSPSIWVPAPKIIESFIAHLLEGQ